MLRTLAMTGLILSPAAWPSEVFHETKTKVIVREHPKTGEPYVSIVSSVEPPREDLLSTKDVPYPRPDYRMLEKNVTPKEVGYEGPYSSKKKIYIFAASMATLGTAGAVVGAVAFPAAAGAGASGTGLGVAGGVLATGTAAAATAVIAADQDLPEDFVRRDETQLVENNNDFYRLHIR